MNDAVIHVDSRGRIFVENATVEIMNALRALGWTGERTQIDVRTDSTEDPDPQRRMLPCPTR